jgi:general secretion pathway protein G
MPDSLDVLTQPDPGNFDEPWISEEAPILDPWDNPYVLELESGMKFAIISYGADGAPGGDGEDRDIDSRTMNQKTEE